MDNDNVVNMHTTTAFARNRQSNERKTNNKNTSRRQGLVKVVPITKMAEVIPMPGVQIEEEVKGGVLILKILDSANLNTIQRSKVMNRISFHTDMVNAWHASYKQGLPSHIVSKVNGFIVLELYPTALSLKD